MAMEYRFQRGKAAAPEVKDGTLRGRAAPFNSPTQIGGDKWGFREVIKPGAFKKSLNDGDVVLLDNHQSEKPLARQSAGTLALMETKGGLDWDAKPANTTYANDAIENARAGNFGGCSFGFEVISDKWTRGENGEPDQRELLEVKLHEISVCTFPAYGATNVSARDQLAAAREAREAALGPIEDDETEDRKGKPSKGGNKPYGNVTYADPKNGKYPVDTKAHAKAAWSYINMPKNASKYPLNGVSLASVKAKIKAACAKFGVKTSSKNELTLSNKEVRAVLYDLMHRTELITAEERDELLAVLPTASSKDAYTDDFYERDAADKPPATQNCPECKNDEHARGACAKCGGAGVVNVSEAGQSETQTNSEKTSGETRESEPDSSTRSDDERLDALRRMRMAEAANSEGQ